MIFYSVSATWLAVTRPTWILTMKLLTDHALKRINHIWLIVIYIFHVCRSNVSASTCLPSRIILPFALCTAVEIEFVAVYRIRSTRCTRRGISSKNRLVFRMLSCIISPILCHFVRFHLIAMYSGRSENVYDRVQHCTVGVLR